MMQVEAIDEGYYAVTIGVYYGETYKLGLQRIAGKWRILMPTDPGINVITSDYARALGRALVLAADWCQERNQKIDAARRHHARHGDMDNDICLLSECALHYP